MSKKDMIIKELTKLVNFITERNDGLEARNELLTSCCSAYAKEMEIQMNFIKSSELRYQEFCKYQMECFKAEGNEVEA